MKKRIIKIISLFLIIILFYFIFDTYTFNKERKVKGGKYKINIVYMLIEDNKDTKNVSFDNFSPAVENSMFHVHVIEDLKKVGDNYVVKLKNSNDIVFNNIKDYTFALNDINGNVLKDVKFDKNTRRIIIPKKYYESKKYKKYKNITLKFQTISSVKKNDLKNVKLSVETSKFFKSKKTVYVDNNEVNTKVSLFKYKTGKGIIKEDLLVYLNGSKKPLSTDKYYYDQRSGTVDIINTSSAYINSIKIRVKKAALIKRFLFFGLNLVDVEAKSAYNVVGTFTDVNGGVSNSDMKENANTVSVNAPYFYSHDSNSIPYYLNNTNTSYWKNKNYNCGGKVSSSLDCSSTNNTQYYFNASTDATARKALKSALENAKKASPGGASLLDFLVKVDGYNGALEDKKFKATVGSGDNAKTRTISIQFYDDWLALYCSDAEHAQDNNSKTGLSMKFKIYSVDSNSLTIYVYQSDTAGSQYSVGYFSFKKTAASLKVKKKSYGIYNYDSTIGAGSDLKVSDIVFKVYETYNTTTKDCEGYVKTAVTDANGIATFTGLDASETYCIKESYYEFDSDSPISSYEYVRVNNITDVAFTSATPTPGNTGSGAYETTFGKAKQCTTGASGSSNTCEYYNTLIRYCFNVTKKDLVNQSGVSFNDGTFKVCDSSGNCSTSVGNVVTMAGYPYSSVKNGLTISESNDTTPVNSGNEIYNSGTFYGSDGSSKTSTTIPFSKAITMTLTKVSDGVFKWVCPASSNTTEVYNVKKYQCLKVKKVDKDTGKALPGAVFTSTCSNGQTDTKTTGTDGIATLYAGTARNGTTTTCSVTEVTPPTGYGSASPSTKTGLGVFTMSDSTAAGYHGQGDTAVYNAVSTWCGVDVTNDFTYQNASLKLNWYKVDEDDNLLTNVTENGAPAEFTLTDSDGTVIKHNGTKVATSNVAGTETRNCYQADSNGTYTTFLSDTDGQVCVRGLKDKNGSGQTLTYTVTETKPAKYHTFGSYKSRSNLVVSSDFTPISASNKFINLPTKFKFKKYVEDVEGSQEDETEYTINGETKTLKELTTEELKKITFKVYPENSNNALSFVLVDGIYEYSGNTIDGPGTNGATTELHLNDAREIDIYHLPLGNYSIKEVDSSSCQIGTTTGYGNVTNPSTNPNSAASCDNSNGNTGACIGYYNPDYSTGSSHQFTIDTCSNKSATTEVCAAKTEEVSQSLVNKPTVVMLTKKDFYHYDDASDIIDSDRDQDSKESNVQFENAKERSDFDRIDFKIYEGQSTTALNLIYVGNRTEDLAGRSEVDCKSDKDYALYRYVPGLSLSTGVAADIFSGDIGDVNQTIHTCGGHIKIENLCRGNKYTFKEEKVPDDSVYVKEDTEDTPTQVCFTVPCSDQGTVTTSSTTHIINDKGTRIRFEKRDGKYNYLIPDETTTFEVYRCPKNNPNCHPTDFGTYDEERRKLVIDVDNAENDGLKLIKFAPRAYLSNDREDGTNAAHPVTSQTDVETQYQLYTAMSDSDASGKNKCSNDLGDTNCYVTSLHPDHGVLILRYLQASENQGYTYVLVETVAPKNYTMPSDANVETAFTITNQTVNVKSVDVPNKPTSVVLRKYDDKGNLLTGAKFRIYKKKDSASDPSKSCVAGLKAMDQPREDQPMKLKTVYEGIYEARETTDTNIITTCTNRDGQNCNELTGTLTHSKYMDDWVNLTAGSTTLVNSENDEKEIYTQIQEGEALIQYLEYNHCYIFEEVEAPEGYSLPAKEEDRWSMIEIKENDTYDHTTYKTFINMPTPYQFFKYDEFNKLLDGAKFKLQKLNSEKKYEDVTVSEDTAKEDELKDGSKVYKVDKDTSNLTIETHNGTAFIYYLSKGQYRVVETEAPAGKELGKNLNVATFFVNDKGEVYGNRIITNKEKTVKIKRKNSDTAEFIVNIQTGQTLIRYGLIISIITALIAALMIYNNKRK